MVVKAESILPAQRLSMLISIGAGDERILRCTHMTENWKKKLSLFRAFNPMTGRINTLRV